MADIPSIPDIETEEAAPSVHDVTIRTKDDQEFTLKSDVAYESETIKRLQAATGPSEVISLTEVEAVHFQKCITFMNWLHETKEKEKNDQYVPLALKEAFKEDFVDEFDIYQLAEVLKAAHYLGIDVMRDVCAKKFAEFLERMTVEEIRELFGEPDDLSLFISSYFNFSGLSFYFKSHISQNKSPNSKKSIAN
ncbi:hypothetical protein RCL1_000731 [Eukaryota sp. TZLM3-RCL]